MPYRVILDRMSHEVPYYAVYLKMAALQGTYCINNTFWRSADYKFFGYAIAEKLGIAEPKTVVLPNREYVEDVNSESLRNLWPTDFAMYLEYVGTPCIMKPAFGGGWKDVTKIESLEHLVQTYNGTGQKTMMLQEFINWDTYIRVPTIGRRWARARRRRRRCRPRLRTRSSTPRGCGCGACRSGRSGCSPPSTPRTCDLRVPRFTSRTPAARARQRRRPDDSFQRAG